MPGDVLVVSPHCDDAVFACGDYLVAHPGAVVVTIFAGGPSRGAALTPWDAASGFRPGDDVMAARRREDRAAQSLVGAVPIWLDFLDAQYGAAPDPGAIADAVATCLARFGSHTIVLPLGLFHSDHALAHRATRIALASASARTVLWYEDVFYRRIPGLVGSRLRELRSVGLPLRRATPARTGAASARKRWAVRCYVSQLRALATPGRPGIADAFQEESFWSLAR